MDDAAPTAARDDDRLADAIAQPVVHGGEGVVTAPGACAAWMLASSHAGDERRDARQHRGAARRATDRRSPAARAKVGPSTASAARCNAAAPGPAARSRRDGAIGQAGVRLDPASRRPTAGGLPRVGGMSVPNARERREVLVAEQRGERRQALASARRADAIRWSGRRAGPVAHRNRRAARRERCQQRLLAAGLGALAVRGPASFIGTAPAAALHVRGLAEQDLEQLAGGVPLDERRRSGAARNVGLPHACAYAVRDDDAAGSPDSSPGEMDLAGDARRSDRRRQCDGKRIGRYSTVERVDHQVVHVEQRPQPLRRAERGRELRLRGCGPRRRRRRVW